MDKWICSIFSHLLKIQNERKRVHLKSDKNFGKWQKYYRKDCGLSLKDLAKETGITAESLRRTELGYTAPKLGSAIIIADFFCVTIDDMLKEFNEGSS